MSLNEQRLHQYARAIVQEHKARGVIFDKKQLRFNDIVLVGKRYSEMLSDGHEHRIHDVAMGGVRDAVDACIKGSDMHVVGGSVLSLAPEWMIAK